jgi:hypothetical protein
LTAFHLPAPSASALPSLLASLHTSSSWLAATRRAPDLRTVAADAALLLLVGGLVMLTIIMVLVFVQNLLPERSPAPGSVAASSGRAGTENITRLWPRRPRQVPSGLPVDKAMARIVHLRLGEPRILQARLRTTRVRLYGCPGCASGDAASANAGCASERGGVERAFRDVYGSRVAAWEIACRRRGDDACDFEVRH